MKHARVFVCGICGRHKDSEVAAKHCEAWGYTLPYFKIGADIRFRQDLGEGYSRDRTGQVIDILFPSPLVDGHGQWYVMGHSYQVAYLVHVTDTFDERRDDFFGMEDNVLFMTLKTLMVVQESAMFFKGEATVTLGYLKKAVQHEREEREALDRARFSNLRGEVGADDGPKRTVVTSWADYVKEIVAQNPGLQDRLEKFTAALREHKCLD